MKRKQKVGMVLLALLLVLPGCGKEEIPIEDFVRTNPATVSINNIMKSDTGYYYGAAYGKELSLHYFDEESGQNIFLCCKPECRHDGDVFCTATSSKYEVNSTSMIPVPGQPMMIHRGMAVLPYRLASMMDAEAGVTGTYFYNLVTGELTGLPELEYGIKSNGRQRFTGYGDYIYFNTQMDRANTLSRYCLTDGTVEDMELLRTYVGIYEVMDEDTIYYYYSGDRLFEYKISTKDNIQHDEVFFKKEVRYYDETGAEIADYDMAKTEGPIYGIETIHRYDCQDMMTDGTYLYVGEELQFRNVNKEDKGLHADIISIPGAEFKKSYVHVLDRDLNEIAKVHITTEDLLGYCEWFSFKILDEVVYLQTFTTVFQCPLEQFLTGEPVFTPVYDHEVAISPGEYWLDW